MNNLDLKNQLDITNYYKQLQSDDAVVFSYKGGIEGDLFDSLLSLTEDKISAIEKGVKLMRKLQVISIEILQNIFHHLDGNSRPNSNLETIIFVLGKEEEGYYIIAGNFVPSNEVDELRKRIDYINTLSPVELKERYREQLEKGDFSPKGGAGLGIIDIARKSGQKLEYSFVFSEANYSFFSLKVKVAV